MNIFNTVWIGLIILSVLQLVIFGGCSQYRELTNDPPEITNFTVPNEVQYGETVELRVRAFDPEDDPLTYTWEVSDGALVGEAGPAVQWTAPELPPDEVVPPRAVTVYIYVRDGGDEDVRQMASIIVYSKAYRVAQTLIGTYTLISKQVHGDPVSETGVLRLTTTTFTREIQPAPDAEVQVPTQFITGSYKLIEPFDQRRGAIHWFADGDPTPSISTYTWDGKLLAIFWPATSTSYIYEK